MPPLESYPGAQYASPDDDEHAALMDMAREGSFVVSEGSVVYAEQDDSVRYDLFTTHSQDPRLAAGMMAVELGGSAYIADRVYDPSVEASAVETRQGGPISRAVTRVLGSLGLGRRDV